MIPLLLFSFLTFFFLVMFSCRSPPLSTVSSFIFKRPFISVFFSVLLSFGFPFLFNVLPCSLSLARSLSLFSLSSPSSPSSAIHSSSSFSCFLLLAPLLYPLISHRGLPLILHLILLFRPIVLVLSLLFMIVLLLFPSIFPILHLLVVFPFPLLLFYQFFLISFFLSVLISSFSPSYLSSYHSSVRYPPPLHLLLCFFHSFSLSLSLLLFRVHAVLPLVLYHSSFTSSDILYFFLFVLPFSNFISYVFFLSCFLFIYFSCAFLLSFSLSFPHSFLCILRLLSPLLLPLFLSYFVFHHILHLHSITLLISLSFLLFFHSCLSLFLSCFVLPLLPFHIITILLLFVLSFYISFLHTFSSHFSSPSSFVSFLLSTILWFWFLLFSLLYPIILPHVQSVWSYYECPIPQQCCCLLFAKCMFC